MKTFRDFLEESEYYYHGTTPERAETILKSGLDPKKGLYGHKMYLTTNHAMASKYGKSGSGRLGVVLKIHKSHLDDQHLNRIDAGVVEYGAHVHKDHISKV